MMRIRRQLAWLLALGLVLAGQSARASDPAAGHATDPARAQAATEPGAAGEHGDAAGKPALLHWDIGAAVWSIVVFIVLLVILRTAAWKPVLEGLQHREQFISGSLESARRDREEAKRLMADYSAKLEAAGAEAAKVVEEARRDAEVLRRRMQEDAEKDVKDILARARRDIQIAQETVISDLYARSLDLAADVAGRILRQKVSGAEHRALLDESIAELGKAGRNN